MKKQNNIIQVGDYINVQAYKHNGVLYRQWNGAKIIKNTKDYIVLFIKKAMVQQQNNKRWIFNEPGLWFFSKKELYNCMITLKEEGNYNYFNIASKFIYEENSIKYIDYDLDIKVYPKDSLRIVDRKEFTENRKRFKYPEKLVKNLYKQLEKIINYYYDQSHVFDLNFINEYIDHLKEDKLLKSNFRTKK